MVFLLQNQSRKVKQVLPGVGKVGTGRKGEVAEKDGRRMNMVKIMYTHVCKCKNDTC
jgi:hypothetical protein